MSDEETMAEAPPADPSVGLATAMIVLTTVILLVAIVTTWKILGTHYAEGPLK
jgi:hypothetical protein